MNNTVRIGLNLLLAIPFWGFAQQIQLRGTISVHNSGYDTDQIEYLQDVFISTPHAIPTASDREGHFRLELVGIPLGTSIQLKVERMGYEVVNHRDLQQVILGRRIPLGIYMAKPGALDRARLELENVSLEALTKRYRETRRRLEMKGKESERAIAEMEKKLSIAIKDREEALELLENQLAATKARLPELAYELSQVNLDFATEMYKNAYAHFRKGEIDKVIEVLDEAVLDAEAEEVISDVAYYRKAIRQLDSASLYESFRLDRMIDMQQLQGAALELQGEKTKALGAYEKLYALIRGLPRHQERSLKTCWRITVLQQELLQFEAAGHWREIGVGLCLDRAASIPSHPIIP